ncbi:MAG: ribose 5-phosphate isomerase A [SAR324 cluster bacterium]|uniref:Ribose 5-phosphate isomerase A n=1 Tax=SAR324 cluster bacterium TaxID=2024889 RepID=A0A7X9ILQ9_9DELT|nr:ribose 5-phosphate isomerase A [SAR324 cluster bacterium]
MHQGRELLGREIASRLKDGDVIGVGTGSTVDVAISAIGERIRRESLSISAYTTSLESIRRCCEVGIKVLDSYGGSQIAWGFDGADAVDENLRAIKGGGGALLREKILASRCKEFIIIADEGKLVSNIAQKFLVPVEIIPEAFSVVEPILSKLGAREINIRKASGQYGPVTTLNGNIILDARFTEITDSLEKDIKNITGVVENGLFLTQVTELIVSGSSGLKFFKKCQNS